MVSSPSLFGRSLRVKDEEPLPPLPPDQSPLLSSGALPANDGSIRSAATLVASPWRGSIQNDNLFNVALKSPIKVVENSVEPEEMNDLHIHGWPRKPRKLRSKSWHSILGSVGNILLAMAPTVFIVLGILCIVLNGQATLGNQLGRKVEQAAQLGPTIFPILFAAIAGKSLKTIARLCAERGMKLGVLELLFASQTVWGTFESQLHLRRFTVVGAHLFLLWSLSPLGGQASLRLLYTSTANSVNFANVVYLPTGGMNYNQTNTGMFASADTATGLAATNAIYDASLLAPLSVKTSSQDSWGNVKIPRLQTTSNVQMSAQGWKTVPDLISADNFTSLAGLPISDYKDRAMSESNLSIEYAYMDLTCTTMYNMSELDNWWKDQLGIVWSSDNASVFHVEDTDVQTSFFLDTNTPFNYDRLSDLYVDSNASFADNKILQTPRNILFGSEWWPAGEGYSVTLRNCTVSQVYVEAQILCQSGNCHVPAMRPSVRYANRDSNLTPLEYETITYNMFKAFPFSTGDLHSGDAAASELYIRGIDMPFGLSSSDAPELTSISNEDFSNKLSLLLNTYYQISLTPLSFTGNLPDPDDKAWGLVDPTQSGYYSSPAFYPMYTNSTITVYHDIYLCNYLWLTMLLASSIVLLVLGILGIALERKCRAPDIMGYVSSQTYDNPYMSLPPGGSAMDAMERARLLRDVRVKIGDAKHMEDVGHVVFATLDETGAIGDLSKKKHYH